MPLRLALNQISARLRFAALILLALLLFGRPALAHEGHDHGAAPEPVATALPRAEAHSDLFEIVAILQPGGALTVLPSKVMGLIIDGDQAPPGFRNPLGRVSRRDGRHSALARWGGVNDQAAWVVDAFADLGGIDAALDEVRRQLASG